MVSRLYLKIPTMQDGTVTNAQFHNTTLKVTLVKVHFKLKSTLNSNRFHNQLAWLL